MTLILATKITLFMFISVISNSFKNQIDNCSINLYEIAYGTICICINMQFGINEPHFFDKTSVVVIILTVQSSAVMPVPNRGSEMTDPASSLIILLELFWIQAFAGMTLRMNQCQEYQCVKRTGLRAGRWSRNRPVFTKSR